MRQIILASGSPRRKQLLEQMGLKFTVIPSDFDEYLDDARSPEDVAMELGLCKARAVAEIYPAAIVIGSDTIVTVEGKQLGKAETIEEAHAMWRLATSGTNKITSSVAVVCKAENYEAASYDNAFVTFKPYDKKAVETYLETGDYTDKAGAWSIQKARHLMESVEGNPETILGLPIVILEKLLAQAGG